MQLKLLLPILLAELHLPFSKKLNIAYKKECCYDKNTHIYK